MSIENRVPMSDFTEVTDISDNARIIALQDNDNVKIPLQSLIAKTLTRVDEDILTVHDINVDGGVTGFNPIGKVEKGDLRAVSGDEVFKKDGNYFINNKVVEANGNLSNSKTFQSTDFLYVREGIVIQSGNYNNQPILFFYDADKRPISRFETTTIGSLNIKLENSNIPAGAVFFIAQTDNVSSSYVRGMYISDSFKKFDEVKELEENLSNVLFAKGTNISYDVNSGGYYSPSGTLANSIGFVYTDIVPSPKGKVLYKGYLAADASIIFYDKSKNRIGYFKNEGSGSLNNVEIDIPVNTYFWALSSQVVSKINITVLSNFNQLEPVQNIYDYINGKESNEVTRFKNNVKTESGLLTDQKISVVSGQYGQNNATYNITNKSKTGAFRVAFRFKINEDLNISTFQKNIISFRKDNDTIDFYAQGNPTSIMEGKDNQNTSTIISRPPIPLYNSGFGIKSNLSITGDRLNKKMQNRSLYLAGDTANKQCCYKPLSGDDLFQIRIIALDDSQQPIINTRSSEAQLELAKWEDAYIEVTDASINVVNTLLSFNKQYVISDYLDLKSLYDAIYNELNGFIVGDSKIEIKAISTNFAKYDKTKLLRHKYYLASKYPSSSSAANGANYFIDSFPAYITYAINTEWHTFEFISFTDRNSATFAIDGQYIAPYQNMNFCLDGLKPMLIGKDIVIGEELDIKIKDLEVEFDSIEWGEWNTETKNTHIIISDYHPYLLHKFDHEMVDVNPSGMFIREFESNGGSIPDIYKTPIGYRGDGGVNIGRQQLVNPMYVYERAMSFMNEKGYRSPTLKELTQMIHQGVNIGNRLTLFSFDDHNTYMYSDRAIKSIFERYGFLNYQALELGFYVTEDAPTTLYSSSDFISECGDTNRHRQELQKRLQAMQLSNWEIQIHGYKEGYVFQGQTYNEIINAIQECYNILNYYGISSNTWCFAGNYYTPNAIKILEYNGITLATSTRQEIYGSCHHPCYIPRMGVLNSDYITRQVF